jgi:ABC-type Mn2+/Zn2+ transport system ATPase subunit
MRLRYIHLPDYGPLQNVAVVFDQNTHIENRPGSINFVVGLNGTGKSSLLRAVYDVFHSLSQEELPKFPVTLAYDIYKEQYWTVIFHRPIGAAPSECFLLAAADCLDFITAEEWQEYAVGLSQKGAADSLGDYVSGNQLKGNGDLRNWLPSRVLAYTSGDPQPWHQMAYPHYPVDELSASTGFIRDLERPRGWTPEKEFLHARGSLSTNTGPEQAERESADELGSKCILLSPEDIKLVAVAVGLWQAALELCDLPTEADQQKFRNDLLVSLDANQNFEGARRLLNELDWLWPTHVSFLLGNVEKMPRYSTDPLTCFWLHALADTVVQHPLEENLTVISLGQRPAVNPSGLTGNQELPDLLQMIGQPMTGAECGAEALRRLFVGDIKADESLWAMFQRLRAWRNSGLLKDVQMTIKRIRQVPDSLGELDDRIHTYASFSDGEQMLLGRMAVPLLLQNQPNSLILLDEPETHFNDAWKRQIIDIVDDSILKTTHAHVLVSTHTSLALTDVFSCEITRLIKHKGTTRAERVAHPTFGADPGRILLHVFGAPDVIGARAAEFLREKLKQVEWSEAEREKLRALVDEIGSGWPRAKLMELLDQLDGNQPEDLPHVTFDS